MWPFRRPPEPPPKAVEDRLVDLEDGIKRLERRFLRLQGEFTALTREAYEEEDE